MYAYLRQGTSDENRALEHHQRITKAFGHGDFGLPLLGMLDEVAQDKLNMLSVRQQALATPTTVPLDMVTPVQ